MNNSKGASGLKQYPAPASHTPIGVFDSGIGGLGVLRALMAELPHERFVYLADNAHAPYGERGQDFVLERARALAGRLLREHAIKALVVACNTATAAAVRALRAELGQLPIVGIEPALKPAAAASRTGHIGVLATRGTLQSAKFQELLHGLGHHPARFHLRACDGLADAIEKEAVGADCARTAELIGEHIAALGALGRSAGQIDTLVLGCTHYPLVWPLWQQRVADAATLLDPAAAVARQCRRVLAERGLLHPPHLAAAPLIQWLATGSPQTVQAAVARWVSVERL
ncbi:MAG: glutamate racemase [Burkholderiaceae bacterium]|jgi:glutamate racemase|nr:glutamate racemase [Burkholderiaceae bacterium]